MEKPVGHKMTLQRGELDEAQIEIYFYEQDLMLKITGKDHNWEICRFTKLEADEFIDNFVNMTGFMKDE